MQKMAHLPPDLCVHLYRRTPSWTINDQARQKRIKKRYDVHFTCLASGAAVYIHIAASLNANSFTQSPRISIARRGPVTHLRCDKGTNSVKHTKMNDGHIQHNLLKHKSQWIYNPPAASHMGAS